MLVVDEWCDAERDGDGSYVWWCGSSTETSAENSMECRPPEPVVGNGAEHGTNMTRAEQDRTGQSRRQTCDI